MRSLRHLRVLARTLSASAASGAAWSAARLDKHRPVGGEGDLHASRGFSGTRASHLASPGPASPSIRPPSSSTAVRCEGVAAVDSRWAFKAEYRGQLTPPRPLQRDGAGVSLHGGPFGSRWIRVCRGGKPSDVAAALAEASEGCKTAVYVGIPDDNSCSGTVVAELYKRGFKFHHFHPGEGGAPGELIYYRWVGKPPDMVPSYYTALEGVGILLLSPDGKEVLLVHEYGHWKMITGNVDTGERLLESAKREVKEEVDLDLAGAATLVGGWQKARNHDKAVNNCFYVLVVHAATKEAHVDGVEISQAQWFPLAGLPRLVDEERSQKVPNRGHSMDWEMGTPGKNLVSRTAVRFLENYHSGRGFRIKPDHEDRDTFS